MRVDVALDVPLVVRAPDRVDVWLAETDALSDWLCVILRLRVGP